MKRLIAFTLKRPVLVNLVFIGAVIYGALIAVPGIPVDRYPNVAFGEATVTTAWPGAPAEDVERLVTERIEDAVRGMSDIDFVAGRSMAGRSEIRIKFVDDTDYAALFDDLRLRILAEQNRLPTVDGEPLVPRIEAVETDSWLPLLQVTLTAADPERALPNRDLVLAAKELRTALEQLPGVKRIKLMGDDAEQFAVDLDPRRLTDAGVTLLEVDAALRESGRNLPAGILDTEVGEHAIRIDGIYRDRADVLSVVVRSEGDGRSLRVGDLIDPATTGPRRIDGALRLSADGSPAVAVQVLKDADANAATVRDAVVEALDAWRASGRWSGIEAGIALDTTIKIADSIAVLEWSLTQGVALVVAVLLLFLTWRAAVLTASGILVSFLGTIIAFSLTGSSLNELSLLGFVLVVGIIVDDAIVVLENIQRHREEGLPLREAITTGTAEVFLPVVAATLTTCASFLPLLMMTGTVGDFFSIIPKAVVAALVISLIECLLILPLHVEELERWAGPERLRHRSEGEVEDFLERPGLSGWCSRRYDRALRWNLRHPVAALGIVACLFLLSVFILVQSTVGPRHGQHPLLTLDFFPDDTSMANVWVTMPSGTSLAETEAAVLAISRSLTAEGEDRVAGVLGYAGFSVDHNFQPRWSRQFGFLQVELPPVSQRAYDNAAAYIAQLGEQLEATHERDGIAIRVAPQRDGPPTGQDLTVRIQGVEPDRVEAAADDLLAELQRRADPGGPLVGLINLRHSNDRFSQVVAFEPDRDQLAALGLSEVETQRFLAAAFDGSYIGEFRRLDGDIPVRVGLGRSGVRDAADVLDVPVVDRGDGTLLRFADLGGFATRVEPALLTRRDYARVITVTGDLADGAALNAIALNGAVQDWFAAHGDAYPGVTLAYGGEAEDTAKSYASLATAFGVAVFAIYAILAVQFGSYLQPLIILSNVVFSFTGVVLTLGLFGLLAAILPHGLVRPERAMFTIQSFIAIVALTGLVVNDAIVLIDFINRRRADGLDLTQALLLGGHQRMRPILMTTISTIAGLLPMAVGIPHFSITWSPMATCFVAGVAMSTTLTLLVVPVIYLLVDRVGQPRATSVRAVGHATVDTATSEPA